MAAVGEGTSLLPMTEPLPGDDAAGIESKAGDAAGKHVGPPKSKESLTSDFVGYASTSAAVKKCVACIVLYLVLAVVAFSFLFEKWTFVDSLYYAIVTFTTSKFD